MFIETNTENFLKTLIEHKGMEIVIHYNCENCDDEQVTYTEEIDDDMIQQFTNEKEYMVRLECTNCDKDTLFLKIPYIQGIELI
jgi:isocitrate dehydrogenase